MVFLEDGDCAREQVKLEIEVKLLLLDVEFVQQSQQPLVHVQISLIPYKQSHFNVSEHYDDFLGFASVYAYWIGIVSIWADCALI